MKSGKQWFPEELNIINPSEKKKSKPFFFGKLFIQGEAVKGFPPSPKSLKEIFNKHNLKWDSDLYPFSYESIENNINPTAKKKPGGTQEDLILKEYKEGLLLDICQLCTKYHPQQDESQYNKEIWGKHEKQKISFLNDKLQADQLVGIVAYSKKEPAGLIESFPLNLASKLGYPVSEVTDNGLMITCLSVRPELSGQGLASRSIERLCEVAKKKGYKSLEVISFPDEHNWHPVSLYKKYGFTKIKEINKLSMMKRSL